MSISGEHYSYDKSPSLHENSRDILRGSLNEIPICNLSGDEAMEKSILIGSFDSQIFKKNGKATLFLSGITVMKSMVGVGILGLPNVAKNFGIFPVTFLILFVFICTNLSTNLLIRSKNLSGHSNYSTIGYFIYPTKAIIIFVNLIIIFCTLGTCLSELIIFGTTCENLVSVFYEETVLPFYLQRWFLIILLSIIILPSLIVKSIEKLRFVSLIAVISIASFCIIIIYNFCKQLVNNNLAQDYGLLPTRFDIRLALGCLPNVVLAFNWHFNQFPIHKGLDNPLDDRLKKSAWLGSSLATFLFLIVAILGYMTYGNQVKTNFLETIQMKDVGKPLYVFLNVCFTFSTTLTLPLIFFGSRNNCISIINQIKFKKIKKSIVEAEDTIASPVKLSKEDRLIFYQNKKQAMKKKQDIKFYSTSIILELMLVIGAIFLTQLDTVFNLLGAIGSNAISTGLPALFYFKCVDKNISSNLNEKRYFYQFVRGYFYYSIFLVIFCVGSEILKIAQGVK